VLQVAIALEGGFLPPESTSGEPKPSAAAPPIRGVLLATVEMYTVCYHVAGYYCKNKYLQNKPFSLRRNFCDFYCVDALFFCLKQY